MRSKEEILQHSLEFQSTIPEWHRNALLHGQLTLEVMIDIRDLFENLICVLASIEKIAYRAG